MRLGLHFIDQRRIIKFVQARLRVQFGTALALGLASVLVLALFMFFPLPPPEMPAVALVQRENLSASAFLVNPQLVLTSARVVGNQSQVFLTFPEKPPVVAKVVFTDTEKDIALLQSDEIDSTLKPLPLGNSDAVADRDAVLVVGYPAEVFTRYEGSLTRRSPEVLETDVPSNPGNSGGALLRGDDESVIGMILSSSEFGGEQGRGNQRAVPINLVERVCKEHGKPIR